MSKRDIKFVPGIKPEFSNGEPLLNGDEQATYVGIVPKIKPGDYSQLRMTSDLWATSSSELTAKALASSLSILCDELGAKEDRPLIRVLRFMHKEAQHGTPGREVVAKLKARSEPLFHDAGTMLGESLDRYGNNGGSDE